MHFNGFTLLLILISFVIGFFVGLVVENNHQEEKAKEKELAYRRWAQGHQSIADEMEREGWRI